MPRQGAGEDMPWEEKTRRNKRRMETAFAFSLRRGGAWPSNARRVRTLWCGAGKGDQPMQMQRLRSAGFCRASVLLEGSASETRKEGHHMDGATITNERELYEYMFEEQALGFHFVETPDQERTALWLVAMSSVLCARSLGTSAASGDGQPVSWTSIVAKPA